MVQEDQSYIFIPNKEPVATLESKFYSVSGSEEYVDTENYPRVSEQNKSIAAKAVPKQDGVYRYFIRVANTGKIYNPMTAYDADLTPTFLDRVCRSAWKFREVNDTAFSMYLKFLQSKNMSWLHNTEREIA